MLPDLLLLLLLYSKKEKGALAFSFEEDALIPVRINL